jgi:hypothetical protein
VGCATTENARSHRARATLHAAGVARRRVTRARLADRSGCRRERAAARASSATRPALCSCSTGIAVTAVPSPSSSASHTTSFPSSPRRRRRSRSCRSCGSAGGRRSRSVPGAADARLCRCGRHRPVLPRAGRAAWCLAAATNDAAAAGARCPARPSARRSRGRDPRGCGRGPSGGGHARPSPHPVLGLGRPPHTPSRPSAGPLAGSYEAAVTGGGRTEAPDHCESGSPRSPAQGPCRSWLLCDNQRLALPFSMTKADDLIPRPGRLHVGRCGGFLTPASGRESKRQFSLGQLAKHGAEKRVAPSRLRERARIGQEPWDPRLTARRVVAVDDVAIG